MTSSDRSFSFDIHTIAHWRNEMRIQIVFPQGNKKRGKYYRQSPFELNLGQNWDTSYFNSFSSDWLGDLLLKFCENVQKKGENA